MNDFWTLVGVAAVIFAFLAGIALIVKSSSDN